MSTLRCVYLAIILACFSPLAPAICTNCEPDPSSSSYASTAHSRPLLANDRGPGGGRGGIPVKGGPVRPQPSTTNYLGSTSYSKSIPVLHLAGRNGLDVDLTLTYNSRVWTKDVNSSNKFTFNADRDWPAVGFRLGFGFMEKMPDDTTTYVLTDASGAKHQFTGSLTTHIFNSTDNTYMLFNSSSKILTYKNGLQVTYGQPFRLYNATTQTYSDSTTLFRPTQIKDTNGNFITITYVADTEQSINTITDTLGRVITFNYDTNKNLQSIAWNGQSWVFSFNTAYPLKYNFTSGVADSPANNTPIPVLTGLAYPPPAGFTNGTAYVFSYGDWGIVNNISNYSASTPGNLRSSVAYNYQDASAARADFPTYSTETDFDGAVTSVFSYQLTGTSSNPTTVTIIDPSTSGTSNSLAKKTVTTMYTTADWKRGLTNTVQLIDTTNSAVLRTTTYTWVADDTNGTNARPNQIATTLDNGKQSKVAYTYTTNGNVSAQTDYDFSGLPIRTTAYTYLTASAYSNLHILDRISQILVQDAAGATISRTDLTYDDTTLVLVTGAPGHDDTNFDNNYTTRGNLTSTKRYRNAAAGTGPVTQGLHYDTLGNLRSADGTCCTQLSWSFSAPTKYAFPDGVTAGASSPTLTTSTTYYPNTYLPQTVTDPNSRSITYTYDVLNRLTTVTRNADGKHFYTTYDDSSSLPTTVQSSDVNSAQQKVQSDGAGKTLRTDLYNAATLISSITTNFDESGRGYKQSNPFAPSETPVYTVTSFDALGRPLSVNPPSGGATTYAYAGSATTVTDPAGKTRRSFADGAGRLARVDEPGWNNGTAGHGTITITGAERNYGHWTICDAKCIQLGGESVFIIDGYDAGVVSVTVGGATSTSVTYGQNATAAGLASLLYSDQ